MPRVAKQTRVAIKAIASLVALATILGCQRATPEVDEAYPPAQATSPVAAIPPGTVAIHQPPESFGIDTGTFDEHGRPIIANCGTCHATKPTNPQARIGDSLKLFHQEVQGKHGNLTCLACHNADDGYRSLRLADGSRVPRSEVMTLCAQCHGPQYRDYQHGAHGGMNGYWDLSKGGRQRNNCIDCHRPHDPAYPQLQPAPGPHDRFLKGAGHD